MSGTEVERDLVGLGSWPIERIVHWAVNNVIADGSTKVLCKTAPTGPGGALYVTHVTVSKTTESADIAFEIQDEDDTSLFGPIYLVDNGKALFQKDWEYPLKLDDNKDLYVYGPGGKGSAFVAYIEGFTGYRPIV